MANKYSTLTVTRIIFIPAARYTPHLPIYTEHKILEWVCESQSTWVHYDSLPLKYILYQIVKCRTKWNTFSVFVCKCYLKQNHHWKHNKHQNKIKVSDYCDKKTDRQIRFVLNLSIILKFISKLNLIKKNLH